MRKFALMICLMLGITAQAGLFGSDDPPKDFTALKVTAITSSRQQVTFTIQEFVDLLKLDDANKITWEKSSDTTWALKVKRKDNMTDVTTKLAWEFAKSNGKAVLKRMSADDVVAISEVEVMNSFQSYAEIIAQVQAKKKK